MSDVINVVAVVMSATKTADTWAIRARVVRVSNGPKTPIDKEGWLSVLKLTGSVLTFGYSGPKLPKMSFNPGFLFRLALSPVDVEDALEQAEQGLSPTITVSPDILRPMDEPCVRVPMSILRELRGQEVGIEYSRRALIQTWNDDRHTGKPKGGSSK